jgi:tRNA-specific 2-thiouridylase
LASIIFPLGNYLKKEVRGIAKEFRLKVSEKPESQEICFVWDNDYPQFLIKHYDIKSHPGQIIDQQGKVLGRHPGIIFYTIGQRRGLGLGGAKQPLYVVDIDAEKNQIVVGPAENLKKKSFLADGLNWVGIEKPARPINVKAKIRYNHLASEACIEPLSEDAVRVVFKKPQSAITPGQAVVFYNGEEVLGGGWIR